jgi:hypothetical protein
MPRCMLSAQAASMLAASVPPEGALNKTSCKWCFVSYAEILSAEKE